MQIVLFLYAQVLFKEPEFIHLETGPVFYHAIHDICVDNDEYFLSISQSERTLGTVILRFDKTGRLLAKYDQKGQGPGELQSFSKVDVYNNRVYVSEFAKPLLHIYSRDLVFEKDIRLEKGGGFLAINTGDLLGIWRPHRGDQQIHMLTLYKKPKMTFSQFAFSMPFEDKPFLVQWEGGASVVTDNILAAVFADQYNIMIHDINTNKTSRLWAEPPGHFGENADFSGDKRRPSAKDIEAYLASLHVITGLFCVNKFFVVCYKYKEQHFVDILDKNGTFKIKKMLIGERLLEIKNHCFYQAVREEDHVTSLFRFYIKKTLLKLDK